MANLTILEALNKSLAATKKYVDDNKVTDANEITIQDTANNFIATNVEGALAELFQSVSNGKTLIASAITDMGVDTSNTDSFEIMATNIRNIASTEGEYSVTYNLSNVVSSNTATSVNANKAYTTTLTADEGYELNTPTITVDDIDVTSKYYSNGVFSINNVFGNIVITATAVAEQNLGTILFDNGLVDGYTISNGKNYTVDDKITLNAGADTYFGFDQTITFNEGDSISFVIDTCESRAPGYVTRICYLDNDNAPQGYDTSVSDNIVSANLPYTLTHTFNYEAAIKPGLIKYFGRITISKVYVTRANPSTPTITWNDGIKIDKSTGTESSNSNYGTSDL